MPFLTLVTGCVVLMYMSRMGKVITLAVTILSDFTAKLTFQAVIFVIFIVYAYII